ncbi:hypothetical protein A3I48_04370 [Candidatus Daviesbacteria bacterium RIFCSPLOWO2_02_FULL_36_7]|uniref:O-antigen ligase-related domain-containing protein n=1 Tax=Candidatus Daviesbacteria bacterium RIFCSPLOWO2_02_FULL_36_7 TaxID=1797792 RepID=A0A1F5MHH8_9BACT|nr:MAG: hypothetical protein A3I48_04370 [Candidatus Daviesbacteria bacterium RIFCSPLOWO2_02_FULL_36_7]
MKIKVIKAFLLGTLFFLPLIGAMGNFGYEQIKVLFFIVSITLIGFWWMGKDFKWTLISITAFLFISILLITSSNGLDFKNSLLGKEPYYQGWILYVYLFLFYLMIKTFKIDLKKYALVLSISALLVSILAIYDWILLNIYSQTVPTYASRVVSTFGQPNFYAGFLLLTLPFSYYLFRVNYLGLISGLISVVGIFVSYSRSTILMALVLMILGLLNQLKIKFKIGLVVLMIVSVGIVIALKLSSGIVGSEITQPSLTKNPDLTRESVEKRVYIWPQALKIALQRPLTGYGLENINQAFSQFFEINRHLLFEENLNISPVLISLKELNIDRSHSYILDLLLFSGIFGLISWLLLVILMLKKAINSKILLVSFLTYFVWSQIQNQGVVHLVYFWLLVGLIDQDRS